MEKIITKKVQGFENTENSLNETLFHNANGYIGVRGCLEEGTPAKWDTMRGTYINGMYDIVGMKQAESLCNFIEEKETMVNVVDTQTIQLLLEEEPVSFSTGEMKKHTRTLNMEEGYTKRTFSYTGKKGKTIDVSIKRMASFEELSLFAMQYEVLAKDAATSLTFRSFHITNVHNYCDPTDPRLASSPEQFLTTEEFFIEDGKSFCQSRTKKSHLSCCSAVGHTLSQTIKPARTCTLGTEDGAFYEAHITLEKGESVVLTKYTILTDSIREENPMNVAKEKLALVMQKGLPYYFEKQKEYLDAFWADSCLSIEGDKKTSDALTYNMYALLQSAAKDAHCSIAAKGLSGEGYEGHYFWDTEMFMFPFFLLTNPKLAQNLLLYRYQTLQKARENARLLGHKSGALYPWRTITGVECSGYFPSGTAAYHINGDIAYAVVQYYLTTKDREFMKKYGAEILIETARLWLDVGNVYDGRFEIHTVTGPDEYTCMVNNNYYTNRVAQYNLLWAVKVYEMLKAEHEEKGLVAKLKLKEDEILSMKKNAEIMFFPEKKEGVIAQDDSFFSKPVWDIKKTPKEEFPLLLHYHPLHLYRYQVCKQADTVMAFVLFPELEKKDVMEKSFSYYEKITTHDSSLSKCAFSIVASRLGMEKKAVDYLGNSATFDLLDTHGNSKNGVHTANMGGSYMAIVFGFGGVSITENGLSVSPFVPEKWDGYAFKFRYMGSRIRVVVDKDRVVLCTEVGADVQAKVYGRNVTITKDGITCKREA